MSKTLIAIIVVAVTGGIVAAAYLFTRTDSSGELDALVREIRATGAPVTLADLDAFYDGGGGAAETGKTLATLLALIRHIGEDEELLVTTDVDPTMQIPQQMVNDTRRYFGEHRDIASRLHEIFADEPRVRYPADLTLGADTPLEHLAHIRGGTRLLAQEAMLAAIDADPDGAARSLTTAFRLADSLRDEPLVISQLVRIACLGIACAATEDVVNLTSFEPRQLRELEVRIGRIESDGNIAHALLGERVWGMADVVEQGTSARPTSEVWREVLSQQNMDDSKFNSRDYLTTEVIRLTRDYGELIALGTIAPEDRLAAADTLEASINSRADDGNLLAKTLLPALVRTYEAENRLIAQMRCTRAGLAALRFGVEKSSPPTGLESLVPGYLDSVPVDPFTGSILRFRTVGSGFIVYSVGPNGLDDMGRPPPEGMRIVEAGDVAFRVLSTKQRDRLICRTDAAERLAKALDWEPRVPQAALTGLTIFVGGREPRAALRSALGQSGTPLRGYGRSVYEYLACVVLLRGSVVLRIVTQGDSRVRGNDKAERCAMACGEDGKNGKHAKYGIVTRRDSRVRGNDKEGRCAVACGEDGKNGKHAKYGMAVRSAA